MRHIAHIINPFKADPTSDLHTAQPITFASMLRAKQEAANKIKVDLFSAHFEEDEGVVPDGFIKTKPLIRSVIDVEKFAHPIKLPLISDILQRLYEATTADYLIYSNVDIGLYPNFYSRVNDFIEEGHDAFIINRRRLPDTYRSTAQLENIYKEKGEKHPGFDCFVFKREFFPNLELENICIGVPFFEISFSQNLFAFSKNFKLYENEFLTFHLGMEIYKKRAPKEYFHYNRDKFWQIIPKLNEHLTLKKFPYSNAIWPVRIVKWGLHPCIPIRLVLKLLLRKFIPERLLIK